jgi:hypothetical protein
MADVSISIAEIVLDGVAVPDENEFRAALVAGLTALASRHRGAISGGIAAELHGAPLSDVDMDLGGSVARSVWSSMIPSGGEPGGGPHAGDARRVPAGPRGDAS